MFILGLILYGTLCIYCTWVCISSIMLGKFWPIIYSYFFYVISLLFSFLDLYNLNVGAFSVVPEISETVFIPFLSFFLFIFLFLFFCSVAMVYTTLSSCTLICSFASVIVLLISSGVFFMSCCIVHFYVFFKSSSPLWNISEIFLICIFHQDFESFLPP